jgi:hypothetical protein
LPTQEMYNVSKLHHALVTTNILVISTTAMPVELANFHKSQLKTEEDVIDNDQHVVALNSTHKMDTNVFLAKMVMLPTQEMYNVSQLHHALVTTNILVMLTTAMPVELANFHKSQLLTEEDVIDQDQHVDVLKSTHKMDTNAFHAKMDILLIMETETVSQLHHALVTTNILVMLTTAMLVELANFHKSQLKTEEDAIDLDHNAAALNSTLLMDTNAFHANKDILLITETETVLELHHALVITNILVMLTTAMPVEPANFHKSQLLTEEDAIDQDQLAHVLNSTLKMDTNAFHANKDILLMLETETALEHQLALETTNISVMPITAMPVELVNSHKFQLKIEEDAIDQDQLAHALKSTHQMDMLAFHAKQDLLLITRTKTALELHNALVKTKFLEPTKTAIDVLLANLL